MTEQEVFDRFKKVPFEEVMCIYVDYHYSYKEAKDTLVELGWDIVEFEDELKDKYHD